MTDTPETIEIAGRKYRKTDGGAIDAHMNYLQFRDRTAGVSTYYVEVPRLAPLPTEQYTLIRVTFPSGNKQIRMLSGPVWLPVGESGGPANPETPLRKIVKWEPLARPGAMSKAEADEYAEKMFREDRKGLVLALRGRMVDLMAERRYDTSLAYRAAEEFGVGMDEPITPDWMTKVEKDIAKRVIKRFREEFGTANVGGILAGIPDVIDAIAAEFGDVD